MNCVEVNGLLDALMDGGLSDEQRRAMEAHARECPDCAEAIRKTMQLKALFNGMDAEADVPLEAQAKWRGAVKAEASRQRRRKMFRWIGTVAAAVVAVAGIGLAMNAGNAPKQDATLVAVEEAVRADDGSAGEAQTVAEASFTANSVATAPDYAAADSAVVEADGSAGSEAETAESDVYDDAIEYDMAAEDEDGLIELKESDEPLICAAVAQRAPACELALLVEDVDTACDRILDLVEEYEGEADLQSLEDGGANVYIEMSAGNAGDFLSAVLPMDISEGENEPPELSDEGTLLLLLTVNH